MLDFGFIKGVGVKISVDEIFNESKVLCSIQMNLGETWYITHQFLPLKDTVEETISEFLFSAKDLMVKLVSKKLEELG